MVAADVMELKAKTLHLFKVVVYRKDLGEHRADTAADHLGPVHLKHRQHIQSEHCSRLLWTNQQCMSLSRCLTNKVSSVPEYLTDE